MLTQVASNFKAGSVADSFVQLCTWSSFAAGSDVVKMQRWVQKGSQHETPGVARESLEMEFPQMLGPTQEQAPSEMALS